MGADKRRFRNRDTGIVFRVESENCGVVTLVSMRDASKHTYSDEDLADDFDRCDVMDEHAPLCGKCGGEKFTIPGQRANIGWICCNCDKPATQKLPATMDGPTFASLQRAIERAIVACRIDSNGPIIVDPANVSIEILPPSTVDRCDGSRQTPASTWTITLRDTDAAIARGESSTLAQAVVSMIDEIDRRHADAMLLLEKVKP